MANIPFTKLEIPNGNDNYVFEGLTEDDLTELDLSDFPNQEQITEFNENLKLDDYVKRPELTELDLSKFPDQDQIDEFNNNLKIDDYVKRPELTELDLSKFPDEEQINEFNENLKLADYVKRQELTVLELGNIVTLDEIQNTSPAGAFYPFVRKSEVQQLLPGVIPELTNERIVATLDGKNVYEKVIKAHFESTAANGSQAVADLTTLDIDYILSCDYSVKRKDGIWRDLGTEFYSTSNYQVMYFNMETKMLWYYWYVARETPQDFWVTLRYTKLGERDG